MKNKNRFLICGLLVGLAFALTSCLFDSDENGAENWLSDHGMPSSYKVQVVEVKDVMVSSVEAFADTAPKSADARASLGKAANFAHELVLDFAFMTTAEFMKEFADSDSAGTSLFLFWDRSFYGAKQFPKDSLPISEDMDVSVSWKMDVSAGKKAMDSLQNVSDSIWYESLNWDDKVASVDTTFSMSVSAADTSINLILPSALTDSLKKVKEGMIHLQLKLSAPEAKHVYRFMGDNSFFAPILAIYADSSSFYSPTPFRMAGITKNMEDCKECPVLHGGIYDSLVVELPAEPILKALSDFYGDEFPFKEGDGNDVRQTVILAQLTMSRDDASGSNELGLPIQVVVGSFVDSANTTVRRMENYRLDDATILEKGHQNLIFHEGDSLTVQLTYGLRDFVNKASDGRNVKFMMRMGYPFLQEKDTAYVTYVTADKDTNYVFLSYFDYARYDFSSLMEKPVSLKLWLASKRGDEE